MPKPNLLIALPVVAGLGFGVAWLLWPAATPEAQTASGAE